jgi:hypothetical protein
MEIFRRLYKCKHNYTLNLISVSLLLVTKLREASNKATHDDIHIRGSEQRIPKILKSIDQRALRVSCFINLSYDVYSTLRKESFCNNEQLWVDG